MPGNLPLWADVLLFLGALATALTAFGTAWTKFLLPYLVRPVSTAVRSEMDRMVDEHLRPIQSELRTNGGTSLKDAVLRIESQQHALSSYTHTNFSHLFNHLNAMQQVDPAFQELRQRLRNANDTGEMKQVLREEVLREQEED